VRYAGCPRGHHQPAHRRPADRGGLQVRPGHLLRQARPPDQPPLLTALRGPARVRRPAGRDLGPREADVDRPARDQRGSADLDADRVLSPPAHQGTGETGVRIVLGVSGGIAAYKACLLLRLMTEDGHDVTVVPTEAALRFVGAPPWSALSGKPVATDVWTD